MTDADASLAPAKEIAESLLGHDVDGLTRAGGGRNSRIYRVDAGSRTFALKQYPSREDDPRDRLGTEVAALRWMEDHGVEVVPRVLAVDSDRNFVLLSWIEGSPVREADAADIDQAADFLRRVHALRRTPAIPSDRLASEACLSARETERQIRSRAKQLLSLPGESDLHGFLKGEFAARLERLLARARDKIGAEASFEAILPHDRRSLVPSDFGFHNALRGVDGALTFLDFEYFGWDDPAKLTADILLHPGTKLAPKLRQGFREKAECLYGEDPGFRSRLDALYPLFGLRWVLILLNEFHPERWRRRVLAGAQEDWAEAKARQLASARVFLADLAD
jgi:hypothetical protein